MSQNVVLENARYLMNVKKTQVEMMRDRGYSLFNELNNIEEEQLLSMTSAKEFVDFYNARGIAAKDIKKDGLSAIYTHETNSSRIYVAYPETAKGYAEMPSALATEALKFAFKSNVYNIVLISAQEMKTKITKVFRNSSFLLKYNLFHYSELVASRKKNFFVPKHELLSNDEKQALLQNNKMQLRDFPAMSVEDPQAKYYGASPGDVFRIYRRNFVTASMTKEEIVYRVVVDRPLKATQK
jgi:DNA-directed RNA polymerase I, II, and III subunit RPABC1